MKKVLENARLKEGSHTQPLTQEPLQSYSMIKTQHQQRH